MIYKIKTFLTSHTSIFVVSVIIYVYFPVVLYIFVHFGKINIIIIIVDIIIIIYIIYIIVNKIIFSNIKISNRLINRVAVRKNREIPC